MVQIRRGRLSVLRLIYSRKCNYCRRNVRMKVVVQTIIAGHTVADLVIWVLGVTQQHHIPRVIDMYDAHPILTVVHVGNVLDHVLYKNMNE